MTSGKDEYFERIFGFFNLFQAVVVKGIHGGNLPKYK